MKRNVMSVCCVWLLFFLIASPVYAHKMLMEPVEAGTVKVHYEDGSFSQRTVVVVYDNEENQLFEDKLDEQGHFYYGDIEGAHLLVAEDGIGHRVEWEIGVVESNESVMNRWGTITVVVLLFIGIAWFFTKRKNSRSSM